MTPPANESPTCPAKPYHVGSLTYTKAGLVSVFAWLLWGDFCMTLMERIVPVVLPLKLKSLHTPNWIMGLILATIPGILNMTVCPYVSFWSDRYRSRWGRRIPFIITTLPFLVVCLGLIGYSDSIGVFLQERLSSLKTVAPTTVIIVCIAVFVALFKFFDMFVGSVFWYLFNDVVPAQFLGRFAGMFKIVSMGANALFSYFIFKYSETHTRQIFVGVAALYAVGFTLVCLGVKEGEYPPVTGETDKSGKRVGGVVTFMKECFTDKWYWMFFIWTSISVIVAGVDMFGVFFNKQMGLELDDIGKLTALGLVAAMVAMYLASIFIDRWHPMRVTVYLGVFGAFAVFGGWVWLFVTLPGKYYFWLSLGSGLVSAFLNALSAVCALPLLMRLMPKSRYGQFCSAQSLIRSCLLIVTGVVAGLYLDVVSGLCEGSRLAGSYGRDFGYRFGFLWQGFFCLIAIILGAWVYANWYRLGGVKSYRAPAPWKAGPSELDLGRLFVNALMWLPVICLPALIWWTYRCSAVIAVHWSVIMAVLYALAAWIAWRLFRRRIPRDVARCRLKEPPRNGFTHRDIVWAIRLKYFLILLAWAVQVLFVVKLEPELLFTVDEYRFLLPAYFVLLASAFALWEYGYLAGNSKAEPPAAAAPVTEVPAQDLFEEMDVVPTIGPQSRWLNMSLRLFHILMALPLLVVPALMWWMHGRGAALAFRWYLILVAPLVVAVWVGWQLVQRGIRRDMARVINKEPPRNGIPHHGAFMVISIKYLLALPLWVAQVVITISLGMQREAVVFGLANVFTDCMLIASILFICRIERGWSVELDADIPGGPPRRSHPVFAAIGRIFRRDRAPA